MHWSEIIERILLSPTSDLKKLAQLSGFPPEQFYRMQDLSGCDLRGQDLRGLDLTGCNLKSALLDDATQIDPEFDYRNNREDFTRIPISSDVNTMTLNFMAERKISNLERAYTRLLSLSLSVADCKQLDFYISLIEKNRDLRRVYYQKPKRSDVIFSAPKEIEDFFEDFIRDPNYTDLSLRNMILIGLLRHRIKPGSKKDYSQLSLNAFYPPRLIKVERSLA
ncbi:pentapeptide repeat-containing protein [Novosphingobium olei]|uniref:Pentapeptide repeat protein n=1 Tax=Novosphingobium olei TaxID=2728851 RepID=A0A7Y0BS94_9SPHN|nr:pentapeptide repeat-containing protein [Novosphingobium olei]NML95579.1 hypothetical protein [Novosphingobium olei]